MADSTRPASQAELAASRLTLLSVFLRDLYLLFLALLVVERTTSSDFLFQWMRWYVMIGTTILAIKGISSGFFPTLFPSFRDLSLADRTPAPSRPTGPKLAKSTRSGRSPEDGGLSFEYAVSEMQGWRESMEDCTVSLPRLSAPFDKTAMFCVFDGHGGSTVSKMCSLRFPDELIKQSHGKSFENQLDDILTDMYAATDSAIFELGSVGGSGPPAESPEGQKIERKNLFDFTGCTAVTVLMLPKTADDQIGRVAVANAGDSRAILCRGGLAVELSHDHKPESPRERSRIEKAGGKVTAIGPCFRVDWGLNLSRSLGDFAYKRNELLPPSEQKISSLPDLVHETLTSNDQFIVVACDGLFELLTSQEVVDFVRSGLSRGLPLDKIAENLLDECCAKDPSVTLGRGTDNETCILVRFLSSNNIT